jgi:hypothetical protein
MDPFGAILAVFCTVVTLAHLSTDHASFEPVCRDINGEKISECQDPVYVEKDWEQNLFYTVSSDIAVKALFDAVARANR